MESQAGVIHALGIRAKTFTLATQRRLIRQPPDRFSLRYHQRVYPIYLFIDSFYPPYTYRNHEAYTIHRRLLLEFCSCIIDSMVQPGSPW